ncbi:MAG: hypothetical protein QW095_03670 [Nitrososphaerota archaeon]
MKMELEEIFKHYSREDVVEEIVEYSKGKWVSVHVMSEEDERQLMFRYHPKNRKPLKIDSREDFEEIIKVLRDYGPRSFYASINIYRKIEFRDDVLDRMNIIGSTPTWDIDPSTGDFEKIVEVAEEIISILEKNNISKSLIVKWSGRGMHIHIHPNAFSLEIYRRIDPLDIAYSVTEYVIRRMKIVSDVKIENRIDLSRVFTCPLSLHRKLDRVVVCINPDKLRTFDLSWTDPKNFKHDKSWRNCEIGEGDELAEKAFTNIGPYIYKIRRKKIHKPLDKQILETLDKFKDIPP